MSRLSGEQKALNGLIRALARCPDDLSDFDRRRDGEVKAEAWMVAALKDAEARVRLLRMAVEARLAGGRPFRCDWCHGLMTGRLDKAFCSARCRQANHRAQAKAGPLPTRPAAGRPGGDNGARAD
jgi:hypothetical protein